MQYHTMSLDINWDKVILDQEFTRLIRDFLDSQFKLIDLPPYIANLAVTSFSLGTTPPELTIRHIGDPFDAFYEDEDSEDAHAHRMAVADSDDDSSLVALEDTISDNINNTTFHVAPPITPPPANQATRAALDSVSLMVGNTNQLNLHHNYTGLLGVANGLKPPDRRPGEQLGRELPVQILTQRPQDPPIGRTPTLLPTVAPRSLPASLVSIGKKQAGRLVNDIQFIVEVDYKGDMNIGVSVNLLVNYPLPNFISLPIKLHITDVVTHLIATVAYLDRAVYFSFLCDVNDSVSDYFDGSTLATPNPVFSEMLGNRERIDIIKKIKIELEIGEVENNVLRNVGKVERFLTERLRLMLREEIAWPSWLCFDMADESDDEDA